MNPNNKMIWCEGMLLQPHHFQQHDRYLENLIHCKTTRLNPHLWGFRQLQINKEDLMIGRITLSECSGIFPDGTIFNNSDQGHLTPSIEIPDQTENTIVYLTLPINDLNKPEIELNKRTTHYRYHANTINVFDSVLGDGNDKPMQAPIQVAALNLKLSTIKDKHSNHLYLAVAKIKSKQSNHSNQLIVLDEQFTPPSLHINTSATLSNHTLGIERLIKKMIGDLYKSTTTPYAGNKNDSWILILIQTLKRYEAIFFHLIHNQAIHPEMLYYNSIQLINEIKVLISNDDIFESLPIYKHHDLTTCFNNINQTLHHLLTTDLDLQTEVIEFKKGKSNIWYGEVGITLSVKISRFILSARIKDLTDEILERFIKQTKISSHEEIQILITKALPGIPLSITNNIPRSIPYCKDSIYFLLDSEHPYWTNVINTKKIAIYTLLNSSNLELKLWISKEN